MTNKSILSTALGALGDTGTAPGNLTDMRKHATTACQGKSPDDLRRVAAKGRDAISDLLGGKSLDDDRQTLALVGAAAADQLERIQKSADLMSRFDGMGRDPEDDGNGIGGTIGRSKSDRRFSARATLAKAPARMLDPHTKALAGSGSIVAPAGLVTGDPVPLGRPVVGLLNVIKATELDTPPTFDYLRQTTRTNNAAPVAAGGTKPTSALGLERVEDRLRVIAHLSEPIDKYWLADLSALEMFVADEMAYGLEVALEAQVLNGSGTGENMTGILSTANIGVQTWSVDGWETIRKGMTKLFSLGSGTPVVVLNPADHEALDLTRTTTNAFLAHSTRDMDGAAVNSPLGGNPLAAWGLGVVLSNGMPAGTGLLMDPDAVELMTDGQVSMDWNPFSGFAKNELVGRCEGRFGLKVTKPRSCVKLTMTAAP
ncbi:phage major capsid protein [Nocardioides sp. Bht2]|uniref:phage major capsid protein n=1 Tax=Nocardioides sp. Bht2 TaxID=3392297 RepID=UPI0039B40691